MKIDHETDNVYLTLSLYVYVCMAKMCMKCIHLSVMVSGYEVWYGKAVVKELWQKEMYKSDKWDREILKGFF